MIYHVYHACARLRIFLVHKGPGFIPNSGAGFVSWVFSMARTRRRLILIPSARNLRSLFLLASWSALRFWEAVLLRADDGKYRSVSLLSLARAARALLNFSARNSRTRSNPRVLWRTVDSTRVQQRDQAPVMSPLPASFHGRDAAFRNFVPCRRRSASRCVCRQRRFRRAFLDLCVFAFHIFFGANNFIKKLFELG